MIIRQTRPALRGALVAACLAASPGPGSAQSPSSAAESGEIVGTWSGEYTCNQGVTGVTLSIIQAHPRDVRALFHFYEVPSNPGVPTGCFEMTGTFDRPSGDLVLEGGRWLLRPDGYVVVDFLGRIDALSGRFDGRVEGVNCTTFRLTRRPSPRPVPPACRPRPDTIVTR